jgi:rSAM/selenodomain-associated transferase 1
MERLILLAKAPRRGLVKTRLVPPLSDDEALALHSAMLLDQVRFLAGMAGPARTIEVRFDAPFLPAGQLGEALAGVPRAAQGEGDLGGRMARAIQDALRQGADRVVIVGGDAPTLPRRLVEEALARVACGAAAAVVPAPDGGYVALATNGVRRALFSGIPWGTATVLEHSRAAAREAGLRLEETLPWGDLDVAADLPRVAAEAAADPERAAATAAVLLSLDLDFGETWMV